MKKKLYLDYAAGTPIDPRVERVILRRMKTLGNPSSLHEAGRRVKEVLEDSRKKVAKALGARSDEIIFTGSGTESVNLGIFGAARAYKKFGKHIITSSIEHHAVLRACQYLEQNEGFKVSYLDVKQNGIIDPEVFRKALRADTILVSIMYANNEIGTIQPITEIAKLLRDFRNRKFQVPNLKLQVQHEKTPFFHVDACQAAGALNLNVNQLGIDLMTLNGSKIYGPKGVGCLYVKRGINLLPIIVGGNQEMGLRAGTENVPAIAGFAEALEIADREKTKESARLIKLRDYLIKSILNKIPDSYLNGDPILRLPNNINVSFEGVDSEMLVLTLDQKGIQVSTGAACTIAETGPSHVLAALKALRKSRFYDGSGNIRITLGRQTIKKDIDYVSQILPRIVKKLRDISK